MIRRMWLRAVVPGGLALVAAVAAPIPGLFNTGVDSDGALLEAGEDPHWRLVQSADPAAPGPSAYVVAEGFPIPPWLANGPDSKWIGPQSDQGNGNLPGDYTYQLVFDLTGYESATAVIEGRWSSDNAGVEARLNGLHTGISHDGNFGAWSPAFRLNQGFVDGRNTLEFVVNNAGSGVNPTGFRAELSGTVEPLPPPETPASIFKEPVDVTVAPKETASLSVGATGSRPLRYQWRFEGTPLAGATQSTFTIASAVTAWVGAYDVVVQNDWGAVTSQVATLTLRSLSPAERTYEPPGPSSRRTGIAISEIMYQPLSRFDGADLAFVELHNTNPFFEDLSGWRLTGDIEFTFPAETRLAGDSHLVVAADPVALRAVYGITNVLGGFSGALGAASGNVRLEKRSGGRVLEVPFRNSSPWPVAAGGAGHSLVLARPSHGEADPAAWSASARVGGSPGMADAIPAGPIENVVINELLAHPAPGESQFVELRNSSLTPVEVSGCWLRDGMSGVSFRIPDGTVLGAGGFAAFQDLGFELAAEGQVLLLVNPDETRVVDAVRYGGQARGVAFGRAPDGDAAWYFLREPTPGGRNAKPLEPAVIINELLYHPPSGDSDDEFIELFNPGAQALSLSGWRFADGINFEFAGDAVIPGQGFAVVARNRTRFLDQHPGLEAAQVYGDYSGALANSGERVALARPEIRVQELPGGAVTNEFYVEVDELTYADGGSWGRWSDGGGSSLELVEARADRRLPMSWADSDESARAPWTTIESTGVLSMAHPGVLQASQLQILLLGSGDALVDEIEVLVDGVNRVGNGGFEDGTDGWFFQGTHRSSRLEGSEGFESSRSLRLAASDRGDHVVNRVRTRLTSTIAVGTTATIRAKVRWLRGHPEILLRLNNNALEASGRLVLPPFAGTPGAPNSRGVINAGPAISGVQHRPVLPADHQPFRVTARVSDPDGVSGVTLHYRLDPASAVMSVAMKDDGSGPDELGADGVYTALVPGQPAGTLVAFWVEASDAAQTAASNRFPSDAPAREALVRVGETVVPGAFGNYRIWLTKAAHDFWAAREKMSNEDVPVTFVHGNHRVSYLAGARYSGSSYTSPIYNTPTGNLCGYDLSFPDDDRVLGENGLTLDWPIRDSTNQREQLMYWFLEQYGLPNMYRRYVHLVVNGVRRGVIYDDVQQPGRDTVREWFPDDDAGSLWKTDCWNEFGDSGSRIDPCILNTLERFPSTGPLAPVRYRWNWRPRAVRRSANDFTDLFRLIGAVNSTSNYIATVEAQVDVDHWMRTFAMNDLASFWDAFGNPNAKNTFLYKPSFDRWQLMCWDLDVGLGVFNDPPHAALFDVNDPTIRRMYQTPAFVRRYWAALDEALQGFFRTGPGSPIEALLDAKYAAFQENQVNLASPADIKSWINERRAFLGTQLQSVHAAFAITGPESGFSTDVTPIVLSGTAPVTVRRLRVNGMERPIQWPTVTRWEMPLSLQPGLNQVIVEGLDRAGQLIAGASAQIEVTFTGEPPPIARIYVNEWMASNSATTVDPADGAFDDWFELHNPSETAVSLAGWRITDTLADPDRFMVPDGFVVPAHGFLRVWADGQPEQTRTGGDLHVNFRLSQSGETLALYDDLARLVDAVEFGPQTTDVSQGRWPDGAPLPWFFMPSASPAAPNVISPDSLPPIRVSSVGFDPAGNLQLTWESLPERYYRVRFKHDLTDPEWTELPEVVQAVGTTAALTDLDSTATDRRFYQIMIVLTPTMGSYPYY